MSAVNKSTNGGLGGGRAPTEILMMKKIGLNNSFLAPGIYNGSKH
jgi:hypothetical protein